MTSLDLLSVNVGRVETILPAGEARPGVTMTRQRAVRSGIRKRPVEAATVQVAELGIEGDRQADTRRPRGVQIHGGARKAVYAYPVEHFPAWEAELGRAVGPGLVGENLLVRGMDEEEARVGDLWQWGGVRLQVTEPRWPCYKLNIHVDRDVTAFVEGGGRTGWYLAVVAPGEAPTAGSIEVVARGEGPSIADVVFGRPG